MKYFLYQDFTPSLQKMHQNGGHFRKAAETVKKAVADLTIYGTELAEDIFKDIPKTNFGENRIDKCIKYDLSGYSRLITIQDNGIIAICFIGNHDDSEKWINRNKGFKLAVNEKNQIHPFFKSIDISSHETRIFSESDFSDGPLYKKIPNRYYDRIALDVPRSVLIKLEELSSIAEPDQILEIVCEIHDKEKEDVLFDVFALLKESKITEAKNRIDIYTNEKLLLDSLTQDEIKDIIEGDGFIDLSNFDPELIKHLMETMNYEKWMLFMHPDQNEIVEKDYNGPVKLSGVSGSGKTAIIVRRAIRLAKLYPNERILIITINKALAKLIENLIKFSCPPQYLKQIEIKSFWNLAKELLLEFEPDKKLLYTDITWKSKEHIDEIWEEFYKMHANNDDAKVLLNVNKSLLARNVYPQEYLKQEMDWIRSCLVSTERERYLFIERRGRSEQLDRNFRSQILNGLVHWEDKMKFVGAIDYLGLSSALVHYLEELSPNYRSILVDENQDFGVIELKIIRKLVAENSNDIFLAGDLAQKVSIKHHSFKEAGINIVGRSIKIQKNYRNSREILEAAYSILSKSVDLINSSDDDLEVLNPEFADFSTSRPLILKANSLEEEVGNAISFVNNSSSENYKACIAFAGLSLNKVKAIGERLKLPVLDGLENFNIGNLFLSDLEQTKGFEFDTMFIVNCEQGVIPNLSLPQQEWYMDIRKLYVAMTRAKKELILSYSKEATELFNDLDEYFVKDYWANHQPTEKVNLDEIDITNEYFNNVDYLKLTGIEFLYTKKAIGISVELSTKLSEHVTGKNVSANGKTSQWKNIGELLNDNNKSNIANLFGYQKTYPELIELFRN